MDKLIILLFECTMGALIICLFVGGMFALAEISAPWYAFAIVGSVGLPGIAMMTAIIIDIVKS